MAEPTEPTRSTSAAVTGDADDAEAPGKDRTGLGARTLIVLVRLYQVILSPLMGGHCRFHPTCSAYAIDALHTHGALGGTWLAARRILRCHPWGGHGFDPVPPRGGTR